MTLITHIWTKNINVIAGDRRLINKNLTNPIVSENTRKIYANKNSFFSYHGDYDINNEMTMTDLAGDFYSENSNKSVVDIAVNLNRILIENRNKPLKTGFIIGGQFDTNQSAYFNENKIIYDHKNYEIGSRLNSESEQQRIKLMELLDNSINEVTSNSYKSWSKYDEYSNQDFLDIFNLFYNKVHKDPEANPSNGIGSEFDLGIIRNGKYEWIKLL